MTEDEVAQLAEALGNALQEHAGHLTSPGSRLPRQMAAAGLWRCRALLLGMVVLRSSGRTDLLGILLRALWETQLVALYLLLMTQDAEEGAAFDEVAADFVYWQQKMVNTEGWPDEARREADQMVGLLAESGVQPRKLNIAAVAKKVEDLRKREGSPLRGAYDTLYRGESMLSSHAGHVALLRYVDLSSADAVSLVENPGPAYLDQLRLAVLFTAGLAVRVLDEFGVPKRPSLVTVLEMVGRMTPSESSPD